LNKLIQLEELTVSSIEIEYIKNISNLLGHLRILKISKINTIALSHMAEYCTQLEKLFILELITKNYSNKTPFPYFPKLLYLDIHSCCEIQVYNFIGDLDIRYQNQLQTFGMRDLTLYENEMAQISKFQNLKQLLCKKVLPSSLDILVGMSLEQLWIKTLTQNGILRLVKDSTTLRDITCRCYNIDKEFLPIFLNLPPKILKLICEQLEVFDDKKNFARAHPKLWDAFVRDCNDLIRLLFVCSPK